MTERSIWVFFAAWSALTAYAVLALGWPVVLLSFGVLALGGIGFRVVLLTLWGGIASALIADRRQKDDLS